MCNINRQVLSKTSVAELPLAPLLFSSYAIMFLVEKRAVTMLRQLTLFVAVLFAVFQVMLASVSSSSTDLLQVFTGCLTFLLPCRLHSRACLAVSDVGFCNVWYPFFVASSNVHDFPTGDEGGKIFKIKMTSYCFTVLYCSTVKF